jgi:hypothetical protein
MDILIIGAGIFGITTALKLSEDHNVTLIDMNKDIMLNASRHNHNRIHFGFHYPRSIETAKQSLEGYESFYNNFKKGICDNFENYYMIEKFSKISALEYINFCTTLGISFKEVIPDIKMDFQNITASFLTKEPIFDFQTLKIILHKMLVNSSVNVILNKKIRYKKDTEKYDIIINATYFNINHINKILGICDFIPLKLQTVIIPSYYVPIPMIGITIMNGDFCSILPKGFLSQFLLYHVKHSVIFENKNYEIPGLWRIGKYIISNGIIRKHLYEAFILKKYINRIFSGCEKYFSFLENAILTGYYQTVRALPINDDDSRPSKLIINEINNQKVISVFSGKITTCWQTADRIKKLLK